MKTRETVAVRQTAGPDALLLPVLRRSRPTPARHRSAKCERATSAVTTHARSTARWPLATRRGNTAHGFSQRERQPSSRLIRPPWADSRVANRPPGEMCHSATVRTTLPLPVLAMRGGTSKTRSHFGEPPAVRLVEQRDRVPLLSQALDLHQLQPIGRISGRGVMVGMKGDQPKEVTV